MIPAGYMYKKVATRPTWIEASSVEDIYSVSGCVSENFTDYTKFRKHNGYWLFNSPEVIEQIAKEQCLDLQGMILFYYEVFEKEFDEASGQWLSFEAEYSVFTDVAKPPNALLEGYDVTTFFVHTSPECSPLSCNGLASELSTNRHCLFDTLEQAILSLETARFANSEPGPFRVLAVYTVRS